VEPFQPSGGGAVVQEVHSKGVDVPIQSFGVIFAKPFYLILHPWDSELIMDFCV